MKFSYRSVFWVSGVQDNWKVEWIHLHMQIMHLCINQHETLMANGQFIELISHMPVGLVSGEKRSPDLENVSFGKLAWII